MATARAVRLVEASTVRQGWDVSFHAGRGKAPTPFAVKAVSTVEGRTRIELTNGDVRSYGPGECILKFDPKPEGKARKW